MATGTFTLLVAAAVFLAYSNGANDNFKGVATLWGSGRLRHRHALALATVATLLGSLTALVAGAALAAKFSGAGLVPPEVAGDPRFACAVGAGAAATVLAATRLGFPISTTHALTGALVGAGLVFAGTAIDTTRLGSAFALPLLASPLLACGVAAAHYPALRGLARRLGIGPATCVCAGDAPVALSAGDAAVLRASPPRVMLADRHLCAPRDGGRLVGVDAATLVDAGHVASAAAVSFARGLNDTPKIAALLLVAPAVAPDAGVALIALAIAIGGLLSGRRVAHTMSYGITELSAGQGFAGNLATALVVLGASRLGVPVSTTHVSCGALFGIGLVSGRARWRTIAHILVAWVTTLPAGALAAALIAAAVLG